MNTTLPLAPCRGCREPVIWVRTLNEHLMPVNVEADDHQGNIRCFWREGVARCETLTPDDARAAHVLARARGGSAGLRVSHFMTCPKASHFRQTRIKGT